MMYMKHNREFETGANAFIVDNMFSCVAYWTCSGALIAKLTQYFGFSLSVSNMLLSFQSMLLVLQLFGGYAYGRAENRHHFLKRYNLVWRILLPIVLLSPLLPKSIGGIVMVVALFSMVAGFQFISPGQNAWMISCVEGKVKSSYYSTRDLCFMVMFTAVNFLFGIIVDGTVSKGNALVGFALLGVIEAVLLGVSVYYLLRKMPPPGEAHAREKGTFWTSVLLPLRDKTFAKILLFNMVWNMSNAFIGSFAALYQIRVLELNYVYVVFWSTLGNVLRVVSIPLFARMASRIGWKKVVTIGMGLVLLTGVLWMFTTKQTYGLMFPIVSLLAPVPNGALGVGLFQFQVQNCPPEETSIYFSTTAALGGLSAILGTSMCSTLVEVLTRQSATPAYWLVFGVGIVGIAITMALTQRAPLEKR